MATLDPKLEEFTHDPLDLSKDSIRLVEVLPIKGPLIHCKISHGLLKNTHVCLSYTWGSPLEDKCILLNGKRFKLRQNLWDFLDVARETHANILLWIDAICIIQDETNPEKAHQVRRMGQIYHQAKNVLVWLGKAKGGNVEKCFEIVCRNGTFDQPDMDYVDCMSLWQHYSDICNLEYWQRAWIVQELSLARQLTLLLGNQECKWHTFTGFWDRVVGSNGKTGSAPHTLLERLSRASVARFIHSIDPAGIAWRPKPLRALLKEYGLQHCYDPRDRVYSLLSLSSDAKDLIVDYEIEVHELFMNTLVASSGGGCFGCLAFRLLDDLCMKDVLHENPLTASGVTLWSLYTKLPASLRDKSFVELRLSEYQVIKPKDIHDWNWTYMIREDPDDDDPNLEIPLEEWQVRGFDEMPLSWRDSNGIVCNLGSLDNHKVFLRFGRAAPTDAWRCTAISFQAGKFYTYQSIEYTYQSIELGRDNTDVTIVERSGLPRFYSSSNKYYLTLTRNGLLGLLSVLRPHIFCLSDFPSDHRFL